ncbi:MAG: iron complex transport system substrate-binding protein [Mycobacterium sp.]|nr:iron complex transport system substrate-binding protein [Mycobacterium sp.]
MTFPAAPKRVVILNGTSVAEVESLITLGVQDPIRASSQPYGVSDDPQMLDRIRAIPTGGLKVNQNFEVPREHLPRRSSCCWNSVSSCDVQHRAADYVTQAVVPSWRRSRPGLPARPPRPPTRPPIRVLRADAEGPHAPGWLRDTVLPFTGPRTYTAAYQPLRAPVVHKAAR